MREIKFRAWVPSTTCDGYTLPGYMDYNLSLFKASAVKTETREMTEGMAIVHIKSMKININEELANYGGRLMQYTGLKDKNGKEVFESDIILGLNHRKDKELIGKVIYENGRFRIKYGFFKPRNGDRKDLFMTIDLSENNERTDWEIIGNIYENSELLTSP